MTPMTRRVAELATLALVWAIVTIPITWAQAPPPSEQMQTMSFGSPIEPEFKYARNMAILDRFGVNTFNNLFEYFAYNANHYLIVKELQAGLGNDPDTSCYRFYDVTDPSQPVRLGRINLPDSIGAGDIETFQYGDTTRLIFYGVRDTTSIAGFDVYLDVLVEQDLMENYILLGNDVGTTDYSSAGITTHDVYTTNRYNEMIYGHDHHLLLATNLNILRIVDLSTPTTFDLLPDIEMYPTPTCTQHTEVKNHEVKAFTCANGNILVGVGVLRSGMKVLTFDENWNLIDSLTQNYDHDRTLFPETIINPTKEMWDTLIHQPLSDVRNNKWDHRVCHSVLPYDDETGGHFVLTVDEFTSSNSGQYENGQWIPALWEGIDFYEPNDRDFSSGQEYPIYFNGDPVLDANGRQISYEGWDRFLETDEHRLNFARKLHPKYIGVDPLRLQGAFLRIWDRDTLGTNDTTANDIPMIRNAYDAQESDAHPEGYVGKYNIPEVSFVPTGLHEPNLVGNTLYLAGYNTGARILKLNGDSIAVRAYCRTESYLSNDTSDAHFYMRPGIIMYAKGFYRYIPDQNRPGITYGSDPYNGMWIIQYFDCDSAIVDTIKHIAFQDKVQIGTVEQGKPMHFRFGAGGAVISDSTIVELVDNTTFSWDSEDSLVVLGRLELGTIFLDSTQYGAPRNKIFVGDGGIVYIGGMEKTITGRLNLHVGRGGRAVILAGTSLQLADSSIFLVEGDLTFESCTLSDGCHFIARREGSITVDTAAEVVGLYDCVIADTKAKLHLRDSCIVKMRRGGTIVVYGIVDTPPDGGDHGAWCRLQSMHANENNMCQSGDEWYGMLLYGNWDTSIVQNAFIHHGDPGLWVYSGNPSILHSEFSNNLVGCRITESKPTIEYNRFEKNEYIGLDMQLHNFPDIAHNRINGNFHYGTYCYDCGDVWLDNRIDSNSTGFYAREYSNLYFNEWESYSPPSTCDTTRGNSVRFNSTGVSIAYYSSAEFHCDNSVHGNVTGAYPVGQDVVVYDGSRAVGWGNYPDSSATTPDSIRFIKYGNAVVQWDDSSDSLLAPNEDPVLMKSLVQSPFAAAFARARNYARQGLYQMAQADFSLALMEAGTPAEYVLALHGWRRMVSTADRDSTSVRIGYQSNYWNSLVTGLAGRAQYADSSWMREIAAEVLTLEKITRMDTASVENTLRTLLRTSSDDGVRRRSLLRLVFFDYCIRSQYTSAYGTYQTLDGWYPHSDETIYAKILLRIPLDSADVAAMGKTDHEEPRSALGHRAADNWIVVEGPWPAPQHETANLRVYTEDAVLVDRSLYDIRGNRLRTEAGISLTPGWNEMAVRCEGLATGSYLLVLGNGERRKAVMLNVLGDR